METIYHRALSTKECYEHNIPSVSDDIHKRICACRVGYFLTPIRNPRRLPNGYIEDFKSLPEFVLIDGVEFQKVTDRAIDLFCEHYQLFCAEYYRVDYEGKIKNGSGNWEQDGIIRPAHPMILRREQLRPTRILTIKY